MISALNDRVLRLKELSINVGAEITESNRFLDGMSSDMDSGNNLLRNAMGKLDAMVGRSSLCVFCLPHPLVADEGWRERLHVLHRSVLVFRLHADLLHYTMNPILPRESLQNESHAH